MTRGTLITRIVASAALLVALAGTSSSGIGRKFFDDDPLGREPDSQNASGVEPWDIDLFWDLTENMFTRPGDPAVNVPAGNVNTIDEVPDSSWFTNRILARPLSVDEVVRGPLTGSGPAAGKWAVVRPKTAGFAPGFTMTDPAVNCGSCPSTRTASPRRRRAQSRSPTEFSGHSDTGRSRTT